jgi:hypothetical protein
MAYMDNKFSLLEVKIIFTVKALTEGIAREEKNLLEARIFEGLENFTNVNPSLPKAKDARAALKVLRADLKRFKTAPKRDEQYPDQASYPFPNWKLRSDGRAEKWATEQSYTDALRTHEAYKSVMKKLSMPVETD